MKSLRLKLLTIFIIWLVSYGWFYLPVEGTQKMETILIVPIGKVDAEIMEDLKTGLKGVWARDIAIGKATAEPDYAYNPKRKQYSGEGILNKLQNEYATSNYEKVLGVVDHDLYVPDLNFIFGLAGNKEVIIAISRLRPQFYGLIKNKSLFNKRVLSEAVHELGHAYGLQHCLNNYCVMFFSNTLTDTDTKGYNFCPVCRKKLTGG